MSRHPNNGPSFTEAPYKKLRPMTEDELAAYYRRKSYDLKRNEESCVETRKLNKALRTDVPAALAMIGLPSSPLPNNTQIERKF